MALAAFAICGCNEPAQVSGPEFVAMLNRNPESMRSTEFVGVRDGQAVLKVTTMSLVNQRRWSDTFFVTAVTNLPKDFLNSVSAPFRRESDYEPTASAVDVATRAARED